MNIKHFLVILAVLLALTPLTAFGKDVPPIGAVYAMSNAQDGNEIVVFARDFRGRLTHTGAFATGGIGTGGGIDPLASQGSLILSPNKRWLFAVNAASDDISVFRVHRKYLELIGYFESGGDFPVSLTIAHNLLYVLNAGTGGTGPNIAGFKIDRRGRLKPLADSTRTLDPGGYHQVGFNPRGDKLVVTQGDPNGANQILVFDVDEDGLPGETPGVTPSSGVVPFGFIFDWRGHLIVSEAGSGAVSTYEILDDNSLSIISATVANGNAATCWIAGTWFGAVFTANTGSDNLSSYRVRLADGSATLREADAGSGDKPIDMAITTSGRFLYALNAGDGTVGAFRISPKGTLRDLGRTAGLPPQFAQGIAVR